MGMSVPACPRLRRSLPCTYYVSKLLRLFWKARWRLFDSWTCLFLPSQRGSWDGGGGEGRGARGVPLRRPFSDLERGTNAWELELSDAEWLQRAKPLELSVVQAPRNPLDDALGSP